MSTSASRKRRHRRKWRLSKEEAPFVCNRYTPRAVQRILQCHEKRPYPDRQSARLACEAIWLRNGERLRPYRCKAPNVGGGGHFHIGHSRRDRRYSENEYRSTP